MPYGHRTVPRPKPPKRRPPASQGHPSQGAPTAGGGTKSKPVVYKGPTRSKYRGIPSPAASRKDPKRVNRGIRKFQPPRVRAKQERQFFRSKNKVLARQIAGRHGLLKPREVRKVLNTSSSTDEAAERLRNKTVKRYYDAERSGKRITSTQKQASAEQLKRAGYVPSKLKGTDILNQFTRPGAALMRGVAQSSRNRGLPAQAQGSVAKEMVRGFKSNDPQPRRFARDVVGVKGKTAQKIVGTAASFVVDPLALTPVKPLSTAARARKAAKAAAGLSRADKIERAGAAGFKEELHTPQSRKAARKARSARSRAAYQASLRSRRSRVQRALTGPEGQVRVSGDTGRLARIVPTRPLDITPQQRKRLNALDRRRRGEELSHAREEATHTRAARRVATKRNRRGPFQKKLGKEQSARLRAAIEDRTVHELPKHEQRAARRLMAQTERLHAAERAAAHEAGERPAGRYTPQGPDDPQGYFPRIHETEIKDRSLRVKVRKTGQKISKRPPDDDIPPVSKRVRTTSLQNLMRQDRRRFAETDADYVRDVEATMYAKGAKSSQRAARIRYRGRVQQEFGRAVKPKSKLAPGEGVYAVRRTDKGERLTELTGEELAKAVNSGTKNAVIMPRAVYREAAKRLEPTGYVPVIDPITNHLKWVLTIPNPQYWARNAFGGLFNVWEGGVGVPSLAKNTVKALRINRATTRNIRKAELGHEGGRKVVGTRTVEAGSQPGGPDTLSLPIDRATRKAKMRQERKLQKRELNEARREVAGLKRRGAKHDKPVLDDYGRVVDEPQRFRAHNTAIYKAMEEQLEQKSNAELTRIAQQAQRAIAKLREEAQTLPRRSAAAFTREDGAEDWVTIEQTANKAAQLGSRMSKAEETLNLIGQIKLARAQGRVNAGTARLRDMRRPAIGQRWAHGTREEFPFGQGYGNKLRTFHVGTPRQAAARLHDIHASPGYGPTVEPHIFEFHTRLGVQEIRMSDIMANSFEDFVMKYRQGGAEARSVDHRVKQYVQRLKQDEGIYRGEGYREKAENMERAWDLFKKGKLSAIRYENHGETGLSRRVARPQSDERPLRKDSAAIERKFKDFGKLDSLMVVRPEDYKPFPRRGVPDDEPYSASSRKLRDVQVRERPARPEPRQIRILGDTEIKVGKAGKMKVRDLIREMQEANVAGAGQSVELTGAAMRPRHFAQSAEDLPRVAAYLHYRGKGLAPDEASRMVQKTQFDYGELTAFERRVARRIWPFYTWRSRNIALQARTAVFRPKKIADFERVRDLMTDISGIDPDWEKNLQRGEALQMPFPLPWKASNGRPMLAYAALPITDFNVLTGDPRTAFEQAMQMANPVVKNPIEFITGYSFYWRDQIEDDYNRWTPAPDRAIKLLEASPAPFIDGLEAAGIVRKDGEGQWHWRGRADYIAQMVPISSLMTMAATTSEGKRGNTWLDRTIGWSTGVRPGKYRPQYNKLQKLFDEANAIDKKLADLGELDLDKGEHGRYTKEKADLAQKMNRVQWAIFDLRKRLGEDPSKPQTKRGKVYTRGYDPEHPVEGKYGFGGGSSGSGGANYGFGGPEAPTSRSKKSLKKAKEAYGF